MDTPPVAQDRSRTFLGEAQCVLFTVRRGERTVRCYVTRGTLAACFGVPCEPGEPAAEHALRCYDAHAKEIQSVARRLIERRGAPGGALIVDIAGACVEACHE
jgi:hypothetical protein